MIYELSYKGYRLGMFPTEAEAVRRASRMDATRFGNGWTKANL